jgi:cytochrome c5
MILIARPLSSLISLILMFVSSIVLAGKTGSEIYQTYCTVCHASGLAGAPKFQSKQDWLPRCQQKHMKGLVESAIKGLNAMPAKGTCESCQENDIREAIEYMVPKDEKTCHEK